MGSSAPLGTKDLFNTPGAELPGYVREVARELMKKGKTKSQAIQIAIGVIKRWAAEGKPKAVEAVRQWEAAKAKARATPNKSDHSNPFEPGDLLLAQPDFAADGHAMIALEVPAGAIPQVPGGVPQDDMHLTVQYLGQGISDLEFARAISSALSAAQDVGPITGTVGGLGVFPMKEDADKQAVWVTVDAPGVQRLHEYTQNRGSRGVPHGFTPHITVKWIEPGGSLPKPIPKTPITFTHLIVKRGDQLFRFTLGGDYREWSNPLATSGRSVLLAQAPEPPAAKKKEKKPPEKTAAQGQRFKHGWIPVDENGKPTGPSQKPAWLKNAEAKHKAAGGRTAEQIQAEKAQAEFKGRAEKAAAPAKKAAAEKKAAEHKAARTAETEKKHVATAAKAKAAAKERTAKQAERDAEKKKTDRDKLVSSAYKQALADLKAGRQLSEQQRRVVAHVRAQQKKTAAKLRRVDVKGADGSSVAAKAPAQAKPSGSVTANTVNKSATVVRARSYTSGQQNRNRSRRRGGSANLANESEGVNAVLDFAGKNNPLGQLAFRYKHGWILINPAIPSRGAGGGGLARRHGHKSGTVTHGHFEPSATGGKKFVPDRTGGKTSAQKVAELKLKSGANEQKKYGLTAAQKDSGGSALKPTIASPSQLTEKKNAATKAAILAKKSNTVQDAQVAAKKYADSFVAHKKAGDTATAEHQKSSAQEWAKKAAQLKKAESASAAAKKAHDAAKAEAEKSAKAKTAALEIYETGHQDGNAQMMQIIKAQALANPDKFGGIKLSDFDSIDKKYADEKAKAEKKAAAEKLSDEAFDASNDAFEGNKYTLHNMAAEQHAEAAKAVHAFGMAEKEKEHIIAVDFHKKKAAKLKAEKEAENNGPAPNVKKSQDAAELNTAIDDVLEGLDLDVPGGIDSWQNFLKASHKAKTEPNTDNMAAMTDAYKQLKSEGVTPDQLSNANSVLFKKTGLTVAPKKKTVAQKKASAKPVFKTDAQLKADAIEAYKNAPAEKKAALKKSAMQLGATNADLGLPDEPVTVPEIELPGPGMYADGNAIIQGKKKADKLPEGPKKDAQLTAVSNAMKEFKEKHGKTFDITAVEIASTDTFVPHSSDLNEHPMYADAVDAGFHPVNIGESANGDWKPSDVPGLKSHGGAFHYSGGSYSEINAQLRKHKKATGGSNDGAIAQMDKEFAAVPPLDEGIVTTRRMSSKGPFPEIPPPMEPGAVYQDHGYSSTSKDPGVWSGSVVMQVRIPPGARVLDLNHTTGSQHSSEQEILLNRGSKYRIVSDEMKAGERKITVELVV